MQYRSKIKNGALSLVILALPIMSIACADPIKPADKSETTPAAFTDTGILGLHFEDVDKHAPTVKQVFPDTPSAKADLRVDDIINEINGRPTKDLGKENIYQMLIGKPNTIVTLKIQRGATTFTKKLIRMRSTDFAKIHPDIWKLYLSTM